MKVAIITDYNNRTGSKQNYHLYLSLRKLGVETDIIHLVSSQGFPDGPPDYGINIIARSFAHGVFWYWSRALKDFFEKNRYDHIIVGRQGLAYLHTTIKATGIPYTAIVYDVFTLYPGFFPWYDWRFHVYNSLLFGPISRFPRIIFDSDFARVDFERYFGPPQTHRVIPIGYERPYPKSTIDSEYDFRHRYGIATETIILHVGSDEPRKNTRTFLDVAHLYRDRDDIIFIRVGRPSPETIAYLSAHPNPRVRYISGLSERDLSILYDTATVFLYTSLYEGFGIPFVEAYAHECLIVSSPVSDMPVLYADDPNIRFVEDARSVEAYRRYLDVFLRLRPTFTPATHVFSLEEEARAYMEFLE